ncbi:MAG: hypothetical protein JNK82_02820 [Myxococcaceae bacterium]|nr:hypothetical protein [Myxococcaceae bacterium]
MIATAAAALFFSLAPELPEAKTFDRATSVYFETSVEELALSKLEQESMKHLGLDPNELDDHRLLAFVIRGFHYRYYAVQTSGDRADLGVYAYNLGSVKVGDPIPVLDASSLEGVPTEKLGATLHALFDPIRKSGEPRVMVAYSRTRSGEEWWRRIFINAFASQKQFATRGVLRFTRAADTSGPATRIARPDGVLTDLDFELEGERDGKAWHVSQADAALQVSRAKKR